MMKKFLGILFLGLALTLLQSCWTDMTSIQSAHLGKKMCKGQIGLYSLTVEKNGCDREMVVQSGLTDEYWTFSSTGSDKVLSTIVCITHR